MGSAAPQFPADEGGAEHDPGRGAAATISGLVQPRLLARIRAQTMPRAATLSQQQSDVIEADPGPFGHRDPDQDQRDHDQADRDVQPRRSNGQSRPWGDRAADHRPGPAPRSRSRCWKIPRAQARRCGGNAADSRASAKREHQRRARALARPGPRPAPRRFGASAHAAEAAVNRPTPAGQHPLVGPASPPGPRRSGSRQPRRSACRQFTVHSRAATTRAGAAGLPAGRSRQTCVSSDTISDAAEVSAGPSLAPRVRRVPFCTHVSSSWSVTGSDTGCGAS